MLVKLLKSIKDHALRNAGDIIFAISTYTSILLVYFSLITFKLVLTGSYIDCKHNGNGSFAKASPICFFKSTEWQTDDMETLLHSDAFVNRELYLLVPYVLLIQAFLFYLPQLFSKYLDPAFKVTVKYFAYDILTSSDKGVAKIDKAYKRFLDRLLARNYCALGGIFCEFLNVFLIALQVYQMKVNLGTKFYEDIRTENPFDVVFPKILKCTHPTFGYNSSMEYNVIDCYLPINYTNESIYSWLWVIANLLLGLTSLVLLYGILSAILYNRSNAFNRFEFSRMCSGQLTQNDLMVTSKWGFSRWLILRRLAGEMSGHEFGLLIDALRSGEATSGPPDEA